MNVISYALCILFHTCLLIASLIYAMNEPKVMVKSAETWGKVSSSSSARLPFLFTMADGQQRNLET